ncbi:heptaprenyl diphosphate synthase component 1 [Solibacillus sp. CAU 1738]|uniref:heptaprenyl diphosphate synthase component 1 n=1 Tax=Solibacillus sp. CAU 1738 TaxID=3140363 RepID=UPI003260375B
MNATYIPQAIQNLKESIYMRVRHRTLLHYTGDPVVDENQLFFLLLPFLNGESWDAELQESAVTVGIVHASLFEHDKIQEKNATSKDQQLTVLSGDYYSGRYYEILAHTGNILLIQKLSQGIIERCEQEITVYEDTYRPFEQWIDGMRIIETSLIQKFYDVYNFTHYEQVMLDSLTIARLKREFVALQNGEMTVFGRALKNNVAGVFLEDMLATEIEIHQSKLKERLNTIVLKDELKTFIQQLGPVLK